MAFYLVLSLAATAGLVLPGRGRFRRRDADSDLRRRHAGAAGVRRDAHVAGPVHLDEDQPRRNGSSLALVGGMLVGRACLVPRSSVPEWRGLDRAAAEAIPLQPTATPHRHGAVGRAGRHDKHVGPLSGYLLIFEIISVHLLVVLIGAAYLARAKRKRSADRRMMPLAACQFVDRAGRRRALPDRRRGAVRLRRAVHGHEAQRAGRADGHRAGAQRRELELHRLRQPVPAERRRRRSGSTAS